MNNDDKEAAAIVKRILIWIACAGLLAGSAIMAGCPVYRVWEQRLAGEAELAKATYTRKVAIQEAEAKKASAVFLAEAEIERAKGVAKANTIIGDSLKGNEDYLRYLWISGLEKQDHDIIYIPTEAGLPILESSRHLVRPKRAEAKTKD